VKHFFRTRMTLGLFAVALAAIVGIAGFGAAVSAQADEARVRITHASPDAPAVDIWVNGEPAVTNLAFGQDTGLISLPAGSYDVAVTPAGSTDPEADAVIATTLQLEAGQAIDVVAVGYLFELSAQVYPIDLSPVTEGNARVQVLHASPDAPAVDILANGGALVEGLSFPDASGYLEVPAGSYDVEVAVSGTNDIALDLPGVPFDAGQVYNVIAIGEVAEGTLTVLPLVAPADAAAGSADTGAADAAAASAGDAQVRITHASPDAPAVDIWVNGQPAVTNLAFGEDTGLIALPAGSYDVAVTPAGSTDPVADAVIAATLPLEAGTAIDVIAVGYLAEISAQVYPIDLSPVTEGNARLQVLHASPDAPAVDILANGGALVEGLAFPDSSGYLEVPAGSYDVEVAVSGTSDIALDLPSVAFEAGQVYNVVAIGEVAGGTLTVLPLVAAADTAVGGAADATVAHTVPDTGIGSTMQSSNMAAIAFVAGLIMLAAAGASRFAPASVRGLR
jgi:hypothetical protein